MSSLASFVASITDPLAHRPNIEDDGNEETRAFVTDRIIGEEGAKSAFNRVSKLRLQNAELLGDTNPRYKGKKISRKNIEGENKESFDPDLAKFCILDEDSSSELENDDNVDQYDDDDGGGSDSDECAHAENEDELASTTKNELNRSSCMEDDFMRMAEDNEEYSDEEEEDEEYSEENEGHSDEDDFSETNDDEAIEMGDDSQNLSDDGSDILQKKSENKTESSVQMFSKEDSIQVSKGVAVKNQCHIFDKLFEARIGLQKVASISNQLPQADIYKAFLQNKFYELYKTNLVAARKAVKKLMVQILDLQQCLLSRNSEIESMVNFEDGSEGDESDGNSSSNENKPANEDGNKKPKGSKRKHEEFEEILRKRHKSMIPFRDDTLNRWQEKSKLLMNQSRGNFGKFEISPTIQIRNILANKDELIKRTQMTGMARGNVSKVLGKETKQNSNLVEEFDPEIFDDSDFYSRLLEDFLKSKISVSKSMTEVSMHWVGIQKLRKKSKRKMEANASKGRKLTHQVITKQQHFMAPTKYSTMGDEAINKLYTSLFGNNSIK